MAAGTAATRFVEGHLGSGDVARVIYGAVIGLALVVALEKHPPPAGQMVTALVATAVAVGLAELYSEAVAREARTRRHLRFAHVRELAGEAVAVAFGAGFPAVFFIAAAAGAIETDLAFTLAKWTGLGLICAYGYLGARLADSSRTGALLQAVAVGAIGAFLIGVKSLLH
jgi:hypothetical protein